METKLIAFEWDHCALSHGAKAWCFNDKRYVVLPHDWSQTSVKDSDTERVVLDLIVRNPVGSLQNLYYGNLIIKDHPSQEHRVLERHFYGKYDQSVILNRLFKHQSLYRSIKAWSSYDLFDDSSARFVIAKPDLGARSIGQLIVDVRTCSLSAVIEHFISNRDMHISENKSEDAQSKWTCESFNFSIQESLKDFSGAFWMSERDRAAGEGYERFREKRSIFEYIENVKSEYRIIFDGYNQVGYVIQRDRRHFGSQGDVKMVYATGADKGVIYSYSSLEESGIPKSVAEQFLEGLKGYDFSLYSFDLFITDDDRWGIFEFSPEFGTKSVPSHFLFRQRQVLLARLTD